MGEKWAYHKCCAFYYKSLVASKQQIIAEIYEDPVQRYIDGLLQDCSISIAKALEILLMH